MSLLTFLRSPSIHARCSGVSPTSLVRIFFLTDLFGLEPGTTRHVFKLFTSSSDSEDESDESEDKSDRCNGSN